MSRFMGKSLERFLGRSVRRPLGRSLERSLGRSLLEASFGTLVFNYEQIYEHSLFKFSKSFFVKDVHPH